MGDVGSSPSLTTQQTAEMGCTLLWDDDVHNVLQIRDVAVFKAQMLNTPPKPNSSTNVQ